MTPILRRPTLAVWRTYTSWWLSWVILAVYLGGLVAVVAFGWNQRAITKSVPSSWFGVQWDALPANLNSVESIVITAGYTGDELSVDSRVSDPDGKLAKAKSHYVFRPDSPLRIPGKLPRLKRLVVFATLNETQLIKLLEFQQLRSLMIVHLQPLSERGWQALERQPLEELEILGIDRSLWNTGRWPRTLKKLLVQDDAPVPTDASAASHLAPLLNLPQLQTVQVRLWQDIQGNLRPEDLDVLSRMKALRTLYVDFFAPSSEARVQASLPHVAVRPATYQSSRVSRVMQINALGILFLSLVLHLLSMQFVTAAAALVPRYQGQHAQATLWLLAVWGLIQWSAFYLVGCSALAAAALVGVCLIPIYLATAVLDQAPRFPGYVNFPMIFAVSMISIGLISGFTLFQSAEADWFFQGQRLEIGLVLFFFEALALIEIARFFQRLSRRISERAEGAVPFGLFAVAKMHAWANQGEAFYKRQDWFWGRGQAQRLKAALDCPSDSRFKQSLLWRAIQPMTAAGYSLLIGMSMMVGGLVFVVLFSLFTQNNFPMPFIATFLPFAIQPLFFTILAPAIILGQQRPFLVRHLLMSCERRQWVRLVFFETARDFASAFVAAGIGLAAYCYLAPDSWWPAVHIGLIVIAALALCLSGTLYGLTLTFAKQVIFALAGIALLILLIFLVIQGMQTSPIQEALSWPPTWWIAGFPLAALSLKAAHHRWLNCEFA